jgi:hypothetical protein
MLAVIGTELKVTVGLLELEVSYHPSPTTNIPLLPEPTVWFQESVAAPLLA